ncbi:MAG: hypothetical protein HYX32_06830 [Actinobacteria bacterium]|nr:hypothetical protein [Actinomycetota bacterium]
MEGHTVKLPIEQGPPPGKEPNYGGGGGAIPNWLWDNGKKYPPVDGVIQGIKGLRRFF